MDRLRGDWSGGPGISQTRLERLAEAVRIQSVAASCRLSGIRVSDREVAGVLRGESVPPPDAPAILGYAAALRFPVGTGNRLLSSNDLAELNALVLGAADHGPSGLREAPAHVEAFDSEGHATGRVIPILPPRLIAEKLEDLLTWFELERRSERSHPLSVIGTLVLGLMAICPFERGNGRTIRALTVRLLDRAGYAYVPYASIELEMEQLRELYYEAFDRAQDGIWSGTADLGPWLEYFTEVLDRHRARVESKVGLERSTTRLSPLQAAILDAVREHGTVDAALLLKATGANRNTLKDNLRRMVDRGMLEKMGQRRTTRYRLPSENPAREAPLVSRV